MDAATAAIISSIISGCVSIAAIGANIYITNRNLRAGAGKDIGKVSLEWKLRQLNELYGPLLQLIEQNKRLAEKIREGKRDPENWRLMDYLPDILKDPVDGPIASAILNIDSKIEELIINKGGLVRGRPPESFRLFLGHYQLLKLAMNGDRIKPAESEYYPRVLDDDVKRSYEELLDEVTVLLSTFEKLLVENK